jgi:tetratricopeptide (TPR) repeat protein
VSVSPITDKLWLLLVLGAGLVSGTDRSDADKLYLAGKFDQAAENYQVLVTANPQDGDSQVGLVHSLLRAEKLHEAFQAGKAAQNALPGRVEIRVAFGDVVYRMGSFDDAYKLYLSGITLDDHCARCFLGAALVHRASFRRKSARACFVKAYELDPNDPDIIRGYSATLPGDEDRALLLEKFLQLARNEDLRHLNAIRDGLEFFKKKDKSKSTELVSEYRPYRIKLQTLMHDPQRGSNGMGLAVSFNGRKPLLLEVDTGASGVILNPAAAGRAGVASLSTAHMLGIGDGGDQSTKVGIAEQMRIGDVEFANFPVEIGERKFMEDVQGLIGTDVFSRFLIKLNIPESVMELTPFPPFPDGNEDWDAHDRQVSEATPASVLARRTSHLLLVRTLVNENRLVWFGVDTGSSANLINEELARKTTRVGADDRIRLKGVSGDVKNVLVARSVKLQFGHFTQDNDGMVAYDMKSMNRSQGVEVSGLLGWPILRQLIVTLNYRERV